MRPIFQMIFEPTEGNSFGLVFSDESEDYHQPVFVMPIGKDDQWRSDKFYLPGEIEGKYAELELKYENGILVIQDSRLKYKIRFGVGFNYPFYRGYPFEVDLFYAEERLKYVGKHKNFITPFDRFIPLRPMDLLIMDYVYKEQQACFVGLTPAFGERRQ